MSGTQAGAVIGFMTQKEISKFLANIRINHTIVPMKNIVDSGSDWAKRTENTTGILKLVHFMSVPALYIW